MIESHPFEPWLPKNAHLLMLGTFPPSPKRWCIPCIILIFRMICGASLELSFSEINFISWM